MLYLYPSNKTENLALVLAEIMRAKPLEDPFESDLVLTQSHGMGVWLNQQISSVQGISCMVDAMMPGVFLWRLIEKLELSADGTSTVQHFEKNNLRWEIFRRLPELLPSAEFLPVQRYLDGLVARNQYLAHDAAMFQISELLADNFDGYQNHRPDWLAQWDQGRAIVDGALYSDASDEVWQRTLWRSLYPDLKISERRHRALQLEILIDALRSPHINKALLPKRLFVFGMAAIPAQWLQVFLALGQHIDVHFMFQNPCRYYWGDILSPRQALLAQVRQQSLPDSAMLFDDDSVDAHPLLSSLGGVGKSYLSALYRYDEEDGLSEFSADFFTEHESGHALANIKNDMLSGCLNKHTFNCDDQSIRFARCHSRLRELESLRDYLLDLFSKDSELAPRDVIVMAPDIQEYSALVHAVFSEPLSKKNADQQSPFLQRIPYGLSDHSLSHEQPFLDALLGVLHFDQARITLDDVFELLALEPVKLKHRFDDAQLHKAKGLCRALNIRWGISESHRDQVSGGADTGEINTWFAGLNRALRTYLMGDVTVLQQGLVAFPLRTRETQELLGKLASVLELIADSISAMQGKRSIQDWLGRIQSCWNEWFDFNEVDESVRRLVDKSVSGLTEQLALTSFDQTMPFSVISAILQTELSKEKVSQRFLAGRVNFCNLMPMRTVPFKVVCVLGMNEGEYPRHDTTQSFDLIAQYKGRRGDRSRRNDDRYMFLEAILAAQEALYISYQGFDAKDNSARFPSVLVSEFQDACLRSFTDGSDAEGQRLLKAWTFEHRLQPYNPYYFLEETSGELRIASFSTIWRSLYERAAPPNTQAETSLSAAGSVQTDLFAAPTSVLAEQILQDGCCALSTWERALANPLLHYYRSDIGLRGEGLVEANDDTEPFDISGLDGYRLAQRFSKAWFIQNTTRSNQVDVSAARVLEDQVRITTDLTEELRLIGETPQSPVGELKLERFFAKYAKFVARVNALGNAQLRLMDVPLTGRLSGCLLRGEVYITDTALVDVHFGSSAFKWIFGAWARHVAWNVFAGSQSPEQVPRISTCVWRSGQVSFPPLELETAQRYMSELVDTLLDASSAPQAFLPEQAFHLLFGSATTAERAYDLSKLNDDTGLAWHRLQSLSEFFDLTGGLPDPYAYCCCQQMSDLLPEKPKRGKRKAPVSDELAATQIIIEVD